MKVEILGVEFESDLLNPDIAKKYDECLEMVVLKLEEAKSENVFSEMIRIQCNAVIDCLDLFFGDGSAKMVFGERTDLITCLNAFIEYRGIYDNYVVPIVNEMTAKMNSIIVNNKTEESDPDEQV